MTDSFADQLRAELGDIETELGRLQTRRRLVEQLLQLESGSAAPAPVDPPRSRRARGQQAQPARRSRQPRGLITGRIREFLGGQREPVHATAILAYLEQQEAAPRSAKPMATLQSSLQRLKEQGELENTGRNHWRLRPAETGSPAPAAPPPAAPAEPTAGPASAAPRPAPGPPVVTSTTRFGSRPNAGL